MKKIFSKLLIISLILINLSGCIRKNVNVVVTSYPLEFLVSSIAKDRVNIVRLDEGQVAQRAQIKENYEEILNDASVIFYINEAQPYFELYEEEFKSTKTDKIDLSYYSKLYDFKRYYNVLVKDEVQRIEGEYYTSDLIHKDDLYSIDPILWTNPIAMTSMGRSVLDYLVTKYPDQKSFFNENFEQLEIDLVRLYADYQKLRDVDGILSFVTMTPSFGNWQAAYYLNVYPLTLSKYGVLPSDELLAVYRDRIEEEGVMYIAKEANLPDDYLKLYNKIKTELDLEEIELHNLYTLSEEDIKNEYDYIDIMYQNLDALLALNEKTDTE